MAINPAGSIKLFELFGIRVYVHWAWFVAAYLIYAYVPISDNLAVHVAVYLTLFAIVTLHEFGHALACRSVKGRAETIILWPLGGVAFVSPPQRPGPVLWSIAAGPLVNVLLVPPTVAAYYLAPEGVASEYAFSVMAINLALLIFNMLPVYPLDGGQILQSILWFFIGRTKSLKVASGIGLVFAVVMGLVMLAKAELWGLLMALFIGSQAWRGFQLARAMAAYEQQYHVMREPWET